MADSIVLNIDGKEISNFNAYSVDADLYQSASAWSVDVSNPDVDIREGQKVTLKINGQLVLTGYIDIVDSTGSREGRALKLSGRDMMGVLVDWQLTETTDVKESDIKTFAETLLKTVPVVNLKSVVYGKGVFAKQSTAPQAKRQIIQGRSIFSTLSSFAKTHGLLFWCKPDGTFVFDTSLTGGQARYAIHLHKTGKENNVTSWHVRRDISKRFAKTYIYNSILVGLDNVIDAKDGSIADPDYPAWAVQKPCVLATEETGAYLDVILEQILADQRHASFVAEYTVPGHAQAGKLWDINQICRVDDDINNLHGNYIVTGRTFTLSRTGGTVTKVRLGLLGVKS